MYTEVMVKFDDETGENASMKLIQDGIADPGDFAPLVTALDNVSDAAINGIALTAVDPTDVGTADAGAYDSAQDKALFYFTSVGGTYQIALPAPEAAIFLPDKETVDPTNADVVAFVSAIETNSTDPNGNALTFQSARRVRSSASYK